MLGRNGILQLWFSSVPPNSSMSPGFFLLLAASFHLRLPSSLLTGVDEHSRGADEVPGTLCGAEALKDSHLRSAPHVGARAAGVGAREKCGASGGSEALEDDRLRSAPLVGVRVGEKRRSGGGAIEFTLNEIDHDFELSGDHPRDVGQP